MRSTCCSGVETAVGTSPLMPCFARSSSVKATPLFAKGQRKMAEAGFLLLQH